MEPGYACFSLMRGDQYADEDPRKLAAMSIYETLCAQGKDDVNPNPCLALADLRDRRGEFSEAIEYATRSCDSGNADGCMYQAELAFRSTGDASELVETVKRYCSLNTNEKYRAEKNDEICREVSATDEVDPSILSRIEEIEYFGAMGSRTIKGERPVKRLPASD